MKKQAKLQDNLEKRLEKFSKALDDYIDDYDAEMLEDFIEYWSEESKTGKTRQSMQKTWNTERRLKTWSKNDNKWNNKKTSKIDAQIDSYVGALNLLEKKYERTN